MAATLLKCMVVVVLVAGALGDEVDMEVKSGRVLKMLREMVNQTSADTLNLPANATSIRENIVDTFSCENRTYGYYADVDNECQLFHVCVPTQSPTGRNITYRFSFICPAETVFNQEVLVCTRSRDSIPCEDSPNYYDLNMEIGKVTKEEDKDETATSNKDTENVTVKNQRRQPIRRKQSIIVEELLKDALEQIEEIEDIPEEKSENIHGNYDMNAGGLEGSNEQSYNNERLGTERYLRSGRTLFRGTKRYSSDK